MLMDVCLLTTKYLVGQTKASQFSDLYTIQLHGFLVAPTVTLSCVAGHNH